MKRNRFRLPSRSRLAIWKSLSVTLVTLLSLPYAGFASLRGDLSLRNAGVTAIVAAPLGSAGTLSRGMPASSLTHC